MAIPRHLRSNRLSFLHFVAHLSVMVTLLIMTVGQLHSNGADDISKPEELNIDVPFSESGSLNPVGHNITGSLSTLEFIVNTSSFPPRTSTQEKDLSPNPNSGSDAENSECEQNTSSPGLSSTESMSSENSITLKNKVSITIVNNWSLADDKVCCPKMKPAPCDNGTCVIKLRFAQTADNQTRRLSAEYIKSTLSSHNISDTRALSLRQNNIIAFDIKALKFFKSLYEIDLSQNDITVLNLTGAEVQQLTKLRVSFNKLKIFDSESFNLHSLYLDHNYLEDVSFLPQFLVLKCVFLNNNRIKYISFLPNISRHIVTVNMSNNLIPDVNVDFSKHIYLRNLDFSANNISNFNFTGLKDQRVQLHHLNLCNNKISQVCPSTIFLDGYIKEILLCNNSIVDSSFLFYAKCVRILNLSNNNLSNLTGLFNKKPFLEVLELVNTNLSSLNFLHNITSLTKLIVDNNNIQEIPENIFENKQLSEFTISGNPLRNLYCPKTKESHVSFEKCKMTQLNENDNEAVIDLRMKNETINEHIKCMLKTERALLMKCKHKSNSASKSAYSYCLIIFHIILTFTRR